MSVALSPLVCSCEAGDKLSAFLTQATLSIKANCSVIFKVQNLVGKKAVKSNTKPDDKNSGKRSYTPANCQRKPKKNRCVIKCLHMWPVAMFYSILDLASVNAFMLKGRTKTKLPLETKS